MNNHKVAGQAQRSLEVNEVESFLSKDLYRAKRESKMQIDKQKKERWSNLSKFK